MPTCLIELIGDLDAASALRLDNALQQAIAVQPLAIMVDCAGLHYISSAGLGVFLSHVEAFRGLRLPFVLYGMSPHIYDIFRMLSLEEYIPIVETQTKAGVLVEQLVSKFLISSE